MLKGKRKKRTFENVGKRWYDFDFQLERAIYCYLCCKRMKRKNLRKLDENLKFDSYHQWKQYICNKYKTFDKERLIEFSRYLNLGLRNIKPNKEYVNLIIQCFVPVALSIIADKFLDLNFESSGISFISFLIVRIVLIGFWVMSIFDIIITTFTPIIENNIDLNMYIDYKEIIDGIVNEMEQRRTTVYDRMYSD